jgi:hypothetical protein
MYLRYISLIRMRGRRRSSLGLSRITTTSRREWRGEMRRNATSPDIELFVNRADIYQNSDRLVPERIRLHQAYRPPPST